ncbi:MAG: hypothetical protein Q8Q60_01980 [Candidatus Chromulinivorax sp.]|nr:hypothetical protein [Candidatus Chromulinivorax sp.]
MKNYKNQFLVLISFGISMQMLTASVLSYGRGGTKAPTAEVYKYEPVRVKSAGEQAHQDPHYKAYLSKTGIEQRNNPMQSDISYENNSGLSKPATQNSRSTETVFRSTSSAEPQQASHEINFASENRPQTSKPTPTDILLDTLQRSDNYKDAFDTLTATLDQSKSSYDPAGKLLVQQAQTLLVRAHPELIQGLASNLAYLPNRFVSYFKQQLPRLTTAAGKRRFTQSVMMEALKSMPELNQIKFQNKINIINNKYRLDLDTITDAKNDWKTQAKLVTQWSRNMITELALLAPRTAYVAAKGAAMTTGASVGAGLGAGLGAVGGSISGGIAGGIAGSGHTNKAFNALNASYDKQADPNGINYGSTVGAITVGAITGTPARLVGLGGTVGAVTGAATGGVIGATGGAILNAYSGGKFAGQAFDAGGRYAYRQGAKLFTPRNKLTDVNSDTTSANSNNSDYQNNI